MYTFLKQPNDDLDFDVDMTAWFSNAPSDDIETVTITVSSVVEETPALITGPGVHPEYVLMGANPHSFKVWLGGGTDFVDYKVTCLVRTEQDRVKEIEFKVKVRDK
jgi:hypothetical protein